MANYSSSTKVRVNAKLESINLLAMPMPADGTQIADGKFIVFDAAGKARAGAATDKVVFLNWVNGNRSDVSTTQTDPMSDYTASIRLNTGGLTGIIGHSTMIGLPKSDISGGSATVVGAMITCGSSGAVVAASTATMTVDATGTTDTAVNTHVVGHVVKIEGNIVWFLFNSVATSYLLA